MICDCQKEPESEISHNWHIPGKLKKIRSVCYTTYPVTGVTLAVLSTSSIMVVSEWNWDYCGAPMALAAFLGFTSPALSVGSKTFNKKNYKTWKKLFQSLRQRSCQSVGCFQRQLKITIYDIEFDSILCDWAVLFPEKTVEK